ncbi:MAG: large subunit ribosomal protein L4 [Gammaproteobacteria bacterium]|jgi:large subunit ribosomal protein L4
MDLQIRSFATGETAGNVALSDTVFDRAYNEPLVHQIVTAYFAAGRRGTKASKSRAAVRGGGAKPFRQKGLGRARAGTIRSPIWRGGGVTFAASPRNYGQKVNRKMYRHALCSILSELIRTERLIVVDNCDVAEPKTKALVSVLNNFAVKDVLLIANDVTENLYLAVRNLYWVGLVDVATIDPAMLLAFEKIIISKSALTQIEDQLK